MRVRHEHNGSVTIWMGALAADERWEVYEPGWREPPPSLELSEAEKHELVFHLLQGPMGPCGPMGPTGPQGPPPIDAGAI